MQEILHKVKHRGLHAAHHAHEYGHIVYFGYSAVDYHGPVSVICGALFILSVIIKFGGEGNDE